MATSQQSVPRENLEYGGIAEVGRKKRVVPRGAFATALDVPGVLRSTRLAGARMRRVLVPPVSYAPSIL